MKTRMGVAHFRCPLKHSRLREGRALSANETEFEVLHANLLDGEREGSHL